MQTSAHISVQTSAAPTTPTPVTDTDTRPHTGEISDTFLPNSSDSLPDTSLDTFPATPIDASSTVSPAPKPPRKKPRRPHLSSLSDDPLAGFLTNPTFTMHERAIYMVIRSYANAAGEARLQQATISETTRYSSRYVRRLLHSLRAKGALEWQRKQYCNCYTLLM